MVMRIKGGIAAAVLMMCLVAPAHAGQPFEPPTEITFQPGTGDGQTPQAIPVPPPIQTTTIPCTSFPAAQQRLSALYGKRYVPLAHPELADGLAAAPPTQPAQRLDRGLLEAALASYHRNHCRSGNGSGPATIVVVDFAKRSSQPRLWYIDLSSASGLDTPILVTHGNGSDPDSDGYADRFSNINDSRMSSLGAFRGAERYQGRNGLSLRLDGLDPGNSLVRFRNIVVHTVRESNRSYFAFETRVRLNGAIGVSDGCFVVERPERERLIRTLENGGFLYAGVGTLDPGRTMPQIVEAWPIAPQQPQPQPQPVQIPAVADNVEFVPGTGN